MAAVGEPRLAQLVSLLTSPDYRQWQLQRLQAASKQEAKHERYAAATPCTQ